jgi:hypothetical protein
MGKATFGVDYSLDASASKYTNMTIHNRLSEYTSMARSVHGPNYDPSTEDLDPEIVIRVGGGKKHGRFWIGDGVLDTASTPTLSQIRVASTSARPAIHPRLSASQHVVSALQVSIPLLLIAHSLLHTLASHY